MVTTIVIIIIALLFSAFFSGMEIAFLSSNKLKLEIEKKENHSLNRIVDTFLQHPNQYITTLLVGNNVILVIYSLQMTVLIRTLCAQLAWNSSIFLETLLSTILIIFMGEYLPKAIFRSNPNFFFRTFAFPVYFFYKIFYPIVLFTSWLARMLLRLIGVRLNKTAEEATFDKVDLANLLEEASDNPDFSDNGNEIRIFQNAMEFHDLEVRDCMVPRVDMDAIELNSPFEELKQLFLETRYSRIPVYEETIDNVVGYVNSKSLLLHPATIRQAMLPVLYVTESMEAQKALSRFIRNNSSLAIVIDEFGGTAGMVTLEDILEEIFGEIEDEHDSQELIEKQVSAGEYVFSARLEVDFLNEKYGLAIPESDEYDTLAGYIIFNHNDLPKQGEVLLFGGMSIRILKVDGSKLDLVRLKLTENNASS
ncbi:MAG: hemolysin family protein [Rikenellaceae bacterium]|jgi:CBS domain containing-hemolysin-like protein|nr:hemolysin family protein [Rikenellaceae bacterium]